MNPTPSTLRDVNLKPTGVYVIVNADNKAVDQNGAIHNEIPYMTRQKAKTMNPPAAIGEFHLRDGSGTQWRLVHMDRYNEVKGTSSMVASASLVNVSETNPLGTETEAKPALEIPKDHEQIVAFIKDCFKLKPVGLVMDEIKWKYLVRSGIRGKNIMLVGPTGSGKTLAAKSLVKALEREEKFFYFNMGATSDPRTTLIGNTHFNKETGTLFAESTFVKAIRTKDAVILLDELTRAHPDAHNILMPVLDYLQRYLRLDEKEGSETVKVADGVTFIATANIGNEYTATRVMDRALNDRFITVEVDTLNKDQELNLLKFMFPQANMKLLEAISEITTMTRDMVRTENSKLSNALSTRSAVEMGGLVHDGFTLAEIAEAAIYPHFSSDGGAESERTFLKQFVQKFIVDESTPDKLFDDKEKDKKGNKKDPLPF